jgi:predicted ATPase
MGIHTGEADLADGGYVGMDVHRAARICAAAHGGQVVLSDSALIEGVAVKPLGEHRLKDFDEAVELFQLGEREFPPLRTVSNTNLPRPASSFVGRERELAEVTALLRERDRVVTLTGPGGTGKTRLAIEVALELVPEFQAGVFWVPLAPLRDPALVPETIAQTVGAKDGLAEHIQERELLLLIDNLEQVLEAASELAALVERCPNLRLLVTSRERLRVRGEVEYAVPPLAEPDAVDLFCARARLEPDETIAELCRRLDNLPLALELAAARTSMLSPTKILERLSQRLDLLKGGRDAEARQRTLRETIEWSYELLDADEQTLFRRLSVFSGGCTLEAAEEVCDADLDVLQSLVDKSLVRYTNDRFWMLETIRDFAAERLEESGEGTELRRGHADHVARLLDEVGPYLGGREQVEWLRRLDQELDNLRAALAFAGQFEQDELLLRLTAPRAFAGFFSIRGYLSEGRAWTERALERQAADHRLRRRTICCASWLSYLQGDFAATVRLANEGLRDAERAGDVDDAAFLLRRLAGVASARGAYDEAVELWQQTIQLAREHGDRSGLAASLTSLGDLELAEGHVERAVRLSEEALDLYRDAGRPEGVLNATQNLAFAALAGGQIDRASRLLADSLLQAQELGDARSTGDGLLGLAAVAAERGDAVRSAVLLGASARIREESGRPLERVEETAHSRTLARLHEDLGQEAVEAALNDGHRLELGEAVEYALSLPAE